MPDFYGLYDQNHTHSYSDSLANTISYSDLQVYMSEFFNTITLNIALRICMCFFVLFFVFCLISCLFVCLVFFLFSVFRILIACVMSLLTNMC